jgi:hypothetical protein
MTQPEARAQLRRLAVGLATDLAGCSRLLERVAASEDAEALRDALIEEGARALLEAATFRTRP